MLALLGSAKRERGLQAQSLAIDGVHTIQITDVESKNILVPNGVLACLCLRPIHTSEFYDPYSRGAIRNTNFASPLPTHSISCQVGECLPHFVSEMGWETFFITAEVTKWGNI